jgi:hypothetical protein
VLLIALITVNGITVMRKLTKPLSVFGIENEYPDHSSFQPTEMGYMYKEKNQCPREGMFSDSFAKARGRDEG